METLQWQHHGLDESSQKTPIVTGGEVRGEGRELGEKEGTPLCLLNCVIKQTIHTHTLRER